MERYILSDKEGVLVKKILFVASEAVPFIKTGGLADVVGALPKCFDKKESKSHGFVCKLSNSLQTFLDS